MVTYNFLDYKGLQTYNTKIKSFIATAISDNNTAKQGDIDKGVSAYNAWTKFLSGTDLSNPTPTLNSISTSLTNLSNDKADKSKTYTKSEVYTKEETNSVIEGVKVSVKNETTGDKVKLNQSVDSTGRQITLTIDESGLTTALGGKVDKEDGKRLMTTAEGTKLEGIEAGAQVNKIETITVTGGDSNISATISNKAATIDLSSFATNTELNTAKSTIDAYTVNGKKINTNPVLTATDIKNGDATISKEISDIKTSISDINNAIAGGTHFIGTYDKLEDISAPKNGDIVIVGNKEYIYNKPEGSSKGNWIELGDTTAELQAIEDNAEAIKAIKDDKTYVKSVDGGNSTYVTVGGSIANNKLTLTVEDSIADTFLTKANASSIYATKTELNNRQITVNGQQGSKVKVTLSNDGKGNTVNVSVDETVLDNTLSTINTNIENITKTNGTIDTKISAALGELDYTLAKTGTTTTNGTAYSLTVMCGITQTDGKITATSTDTIGNITDAQINELF